MRALIKKLDSTARLASTLLARAPSFKAVSGALADDMHEVQLSTGETVHLHLPHHTHLNPGDVLLDSMGMMVRVDAATQDVLAVSHADTQALVVLALSASKQGRALGWNGNTLLLAADEVLADTLNRAGFNVSRAQGTLDLNTLSLPAPQHDCGHDHRGHEHAGHDHKKDSGSEHTHAHTHTHAHDHSHGHGAAGHVHGPDCKH